MNSTEYVENMNVSESLKSLIAKAYDDGVNDTIERMKCCANCENEYKLKCMKCIRMSEWRLRK